MEETIQKSEAERTKQVEKICTNVLKVTKEFDKKILQAKRKSKPHVDFITDLRQTHELEMTKAVAKAKPFLDKISELENEKADENKKIIKKMCKEYEINEQSILTILK